jgi:hypothetical protein
MQRVRLFLFVEAAAFMVASIIHHGLLIAGYRHHEAAIAEGVIALVLVVGLATALIRPPATRAAALASQGFALLGTFVGICMIAIGVGPRTVPDIVYHVGIVILLVWGLIVARQARGTAAA